MKAYNYFDSNLDFRIMELLTDDLTAEINDFAEANNIDIFEAYRILDKDGRIEDYIDNYDVYEPKQHKCTSLFLNEYHRESLRVSLKAQEISAQQPLSVQDIIRQSHSHGRYTIQCIDGKL